MATTYKGGYLSYLNFLSSGGGGGSGATSLIIDSGDDSIIQNGSSNYNSGTQTLTVDLSANSGTGPDQLVKLDGTGALPAIPGNNLTDLTKSQVGLNNVPDVDATDLANDLIVGTFTPTNSAIVLGDTGTEALEKAQGQLNARILVTAQVTTLDNETATLPNSKQLVAGVNTTLNTTSTTVNFDIPQSVSAAATPSFAQVTVAGNPVSNLELATKQYVDGLVAGNLSIQGVWNATTNTPTLADGVGTAGYAYIVSVAGTQDLGHGSVNYNIGDTVFYTIADIWDRIPAGNTVVSVNGQMGIVSLALSDLIDILISTPLDSQVLQYNGISTKWENVQLSYNDLADLPTLGTAAALNVGIANGDIPQLGATGLPAVSGQNLTGLTKTQVGLSNVPNVDATNATNITTGTLASAQLPTVPLNKGGTNAAITANNGGIVYSNATQLQLLSGTATANQVLLSGSSATPAWSTAVYPVSTTINRILYSSANNVINEITTINSGVVVTNGSGVPSVSTTLPSVDGSALTGLTKAQVGLSNVTNVDTTNASNITTGTLSSAQLPTVPIAKGGTNSTTSLNNNRMIISNSGSIVEGSALTNGQIYIGATGAAPIPAAITGTTNQITVSSGTNSITLSMPAIPSFFASSSADQLAVTGAGATATVIFGNKTTNGGFDTTTNYNISTGVFTAPFAGIYHFSTAVRVINLVTANDYGTIWFDKNNGTHYQSNEGNYGAMRYTISDNALGLQNAVTLLLAANDTIRVQIRISGNASSNAGFAGIGATTYFCGFLVR